MATPPTLLFPDRPTRLLKERIRVLFRHFPKAMAGQEEPVHQMRVAARRLRVALPLLARKPKSKRVRQALRILRNVTRAGGGSRDLDVSLSLLEERMKGVREPPRELRLLLSRLKAQRKRSRGPMAEDLMDLPISSLRKRLSGVVGRGGEDVFTVLSRIRTTAEAERSAALQILEALGEKFDPLELHALRIRVRRLRYVAEVSDAIRGQTSEAPSLLKRLQERLGRIHDAAILSHWMARQALLADRRQAPELALEARRHESALLEEAGREHIAFLSESPAPALLRALDAFLPSRSEQAS